MSQQKKEDILCIRLVGDRYTSITRDELPLTVEIDLINGRMLRFETEI